MCWPDHPQAALPWSVRSAQRLWRRALAESGGDVAWALSRLDAVEARQLSCQSDIERTAHRILK
ncbi:hypothetical protein C6W92_07975 [Roseovarius sp. A46]|uniref:DUF6525 family protein n=1 Tax=Roseovarius sp. A46 TaxID=2109331 RepID=UPI0010125223|nr:DUF6525 family protein [Roseovarius sp. A46]RXV64003.1 hypothetical protein C6W92_07975 [Roseovarius sp. A46]